MTQATDSCLSSSFSFGKNSDGGPSRDGRSMADAEARKEQALTEYRKRILSHRELEAKVRGVFVRHWLGGVWTFGHVP